MSRVPNCPICRAAFAVVLSHVADLLPGDRLVLGKRAWTYVGRSAEYPEYAHEQNEYLFAADHSSPGACGTRRVYSQSELESLIAAGFVSRMVPATLDLPRHVEAVDTVANCPEPAQDSPANPEGAERTRGPERAIEEGLAALYGCREVLGPIANIPAAIGELEAVRNFLRYPGG